jgi:Arc/MetJ-type ribon-helix-helix transcriptional regulator
MSTIERITITLTAEMAQAVRSAVPAGEYASSSEIIREALRDWRHKRALQERELGELKFPFRQQTPSKPTSSARRGPLPIERPIHRSDHRRTVEPPA